MTNTDWILTLNIIAFGFLCFTNLIGICFAFGAQSRGTEKNYKLSMLISICKYQTIIVVVLTTCFVFLNSFSAFNSNNFKKHIIKYQNNITAEELNKFIISYENNKK